MRVAQRAVSEVGQIGTAASHLTSLRLSPFACEMERMMLVLQEDVRSK